MVPPSPRQVTAPERGVQESMFVSRTELLGEAEAVKDPGAIRTEETV